MRHLLITKEDDEILHQRVVHFLKLLLAQRPSQIDTEDFRANGRSDLFHFYRLIAHRRFLRVHTLGSVPSEVAPKSAMSVSRNSFALWLTTIRHRRPLLCGKIP